MRQPDNYNTTPARLNRFLSFLVMLLTPVVLVLTSVRILLTPAFLPFEYGMPNFPADAYGFTKADRLYWSRFALDYLLNDAGIEYLGDLRFADGSQVYNERELRHMVDVKNAVQAALNVWIITLLLLAGLGIWAWKGGWMADFRRGLARGGGLTAALVVVIIIFVLLSFGVFFVAFHNVFFEAGTWVFNYSDTLIRLFPERFWRDIFVYVGVISAGLGLLISYLARPRTHSIGR
jgi:integral membrane protein (TIGR01906 family)